MKNKNKSGGKAELDTNSLIVIDTKPASVSAGLQKHRLKSTNSPIIHTTRNVGPKHVPAASVPSPGRLTVSKKLGTSPMNLGIPKVASENSNVPLSVDVEKTDFMLKLEELWRVKDVKNGMVKAPSEMLWDLVNKEKLEINYDVEDVPVASGLFATVRRCRHRESGITYAAKFSKKVRCGIDCSMDILHEIAMLSVCAKSNSIVHLKEVFQTKHEIILILEYAPGGDFQTVLDADMVPFEQDVIGFIKQVLTGLEYIHEKQIAHLDIKPQNIVLMGQFPNCEIKLCDLEVSKILNKNETVREIVGTPDYVAPEIVAMEPITLAADIWSLGVLSYVLLTGFSPFGGDTDQETLRNVSSAILDFPFALFEGVTNEAKEFISSCLVRDPRKRMTVTECLQHSWLSQESQPPSPSPLMLKIPSPDAHIHSSPLFHSAESSLLSNTFNDNVKIDTGLRRSCQTCRNKIDERNRYLSKSREVIFEKVISSHLKKSISKSKERLCDVRFSLSSRSQHVNTMVNMSLKDENNSLVGFKNVSKSQEVVSLMLGCNMKRMINGAPSDIVHCLLTSSMLKLELPLSSDGHHDVKNIEEIDLNNKKNIMKLPCLTNSDINQEKFSVAKSNGSQHQDHHLVVPAIVNDILHEVSDEEDDVKSFSKQKSSKTSSNSSPESTTPKIQNGVISNIVPLESVSQNKNSSQKPFSHQSLLGIKENKNLWKKDLDKLQTVKLNKVSHLIGTFNKSNNLSNVVNKRRSSLQVEPSVTKVVTQKDKRNNDFNLFDSSRRKSMSELPTVVITLATEELNSDLLINNNETFNNKVEHGDIPNGSNDINLTTAAKNEDKVKLPTKKWDYFEIDHPKAISEKKLQHLKQKYQRKKSDNIKKQEPIIEEECMTEQHVLAKKSNLSESKQFPINLSEDLKNKNETSFRTKKIGSINETYAIKSDLPINEKETQPSTARRKSLVQDGEHVKSIQESSGDTNPSKLIESVDIKRNTIPRRNHKLIRSEALNKAEDLTRPKSINNNRRQSLAEVSYPKRREQRSAVSVTADMSSFFDPSNKICRGTFSRAMQRYSVATGNNGTGYTRRQSTPILTMTTP